MMYFEGYGELQEITPEEFYAGAWCSYDQAIGEDGELWDLVVCSSKWGTEWGYGAI